MRVKKPEDPTKFYIKKEDLHKAVIRYQREYRKAEREKRPVPPQPNILGQYILDITTRLATKSNFSGYTFLDAMQDDAIENICKAVMKYNPKKTDNIFNYFTTIAWHAFQFRITEEKKQNAVKHKHYQHTYRVYELDGMNRMDGASSIQDISNNEYSNRVIQEYEDMLNRKMLMQKKPKKKVVMIAAKRRKKRKKKLTR